MMKCALKLNSNYCIQVRVYTLSGSIIYLRVYILYKDISFICVYTHIDTQKTKVRRGLLRGRIGQ